MTARLFALAALLFSPLACDQAEPRPVSTPVPNKVEASSPAPQALLDGLVGGAAKYQRASVTDAAQLKLLAKQLQVLMPDPDRAALLGRLVDKGVLGQGVHLLVAHPIFLPADKARLEHLLAQDYTHIEPMTVLRDHWPPAYRLVYTLACPAPDQTLEALLAECSAADFTAIRLTDPAEVRKRFPGTSPKTVQALKAGGVVAVAGQPGDPPPRWLASARLGPGRLTLEVLISEDRGPLGDDLSVLMSELPPAPAALIERLSAIGFWDGQVARHHDPQAGLVAAQWTSWVRSRVAVSFGDGPEKLKLLDQGAREAQAIARWGQVSPRAFVDFNTRTWYEGDKTRVELRWMTTPTGRAAFIDARLPGELTQAHLKDLAWLDPIRKSLAGHLPSAGPLADGQYWPFDYTLLHHWPLFLVHGQELMEKRRLPDMVHHMAATLFGAPGDEMGQRTFRLERTDRAVVMHIVHTPSAPAVLQRKRAAECIEAMEALEYADPAEKEVLFAKACQPGCGYSYADGPGHRDFIAQPGKTSRPCDRFCTADARKAFAAAPLDQAWAKAYQACGPEYFDLPKTQSHLLSSEWALVQRSGRWLLGLEEKGVLDPALTERLAKASDRVRFGLPYPAKLDGLYRLPTAGQGDTRSVDARQALIIGRKQLRSWPAGQVVLTAKGARVQSETKDGLPGPPIRPGANLTKVLGHEGRVKPLRTGDPENIIARAGELGLWVLVDTQVSLKRLRAVLSRLPAEAVTLGVQGRDGTAGGHGVLLSAATHITRVDHKLVLEQDRIGLKRVGEATVFVPLDKVANELPKLLPKARAEQGAVVLEVACDWTVGQLVKVLDGLEPAGVRVADLMPTP